MITIENNYECFVALWRQLERTRQLLGMQYRRFCIRRVLVSWFGSEATDDFIWEVSFNTVVDDKQQYGLDLIPIPALYPRVSREFLRAVVAVKLSIGMRKVNLKALDRAYSTVFPHSTPINVAKKKRKESPLSSPSQDRLTVVCLPSLMRQGNGFEHHKIYNLAKNVTAGNVNKKRKKPP